MISGGHFSDKVDTLVVLDENDLPYTLDCPHLYEKKFLSHVTVDKSTIESTQDTATTSHEKELIQRIETKFEKWKVHHKVMPVLFPYVEDANVSVNEDNPLSVVNECRING